MAGRDIRLIDKHEHDTVFATSRTVVPDTHQRSEIQTITRPGGIISEGCQKCSIGRIDRREAIVALFHDQGVVVGPGHPVIADLAATNVSDADLLAAVELARQAREAEGTGQPLYSGFIRAKLRKAIEQKKPATVAWWSSVPGMEAQARKLNIPGARPGESLDEFKARIWSAARQKAVSIA